MVQRRRIGRRRSEPFGFCGWLLADSHLERSRFDCETKVAKKSIDQELQRLSITYRKFERIVVNHSDLYYFWLLWWLWKNRENERGNDIVSECNRWNDRRRAALLQDSSPSSLVAKDLIVPVEAFSKPIVITYLCEFSVFTENHWQLCELMSSKLRSNRGKIWRFRPITKFRTFRGKPCGSHYRRKNRFPQASFVSVFPPKARKC